jgi:hypothetical protein
MLLDHNVRSRVETTREEHDDDQAVTPKTPNPDENQRGDRFLQNVCSEDPRRIHRNLVFHQKIIETAGGAGYFGSRKSRKHPSRFWQNESSGS